MLFIELWARCPLLGWIWAFCTLLNMCSSHSNPFSSRQNEDQKGCVAQDYKPGKLQRWACNPQLPRFFLLLCAPPFLESWSGRFLQWELKGILMRFPLKKKIKLSKVLSPCLGADKTKERDFVIYYKDRAIKTSWHWHRLDGFINEMGLRVQK